MGHTVVVVPVAALESFVRGRWEHHAPAWVSVDPAFTHAHITVLAPWVSDPTADDLERVRRTAAAHAAFDFKLGDVTTFANGLISLQPEPAGPFMAMTEALVADFPAYPPYAGEFEPAPHVTLDQTTSTVTEATIRSALGATVPVTCRASRLEVHHYAEGQCHVVRSFVLGSGLDALRPA